jgi:hypothetical protein
MVTQNFCRELLSLVHQILWPRQQYHQTNTKPILEDSRCLGTLALQQSTNIAETNSNNNGNGPPLVPTTDVVKRLLTASRENEAFIREEIVADPSYAGCYNRYTSWIDKERQTEGLAITAKYIEMNNLDLYFLKVIQHLTVTPGTASRNKPAL